MQKNNITKINNIPCSTLIKRLYQNFSVTENKIKDYVLSNIESIVNIPIVELSNKIGVSEASIMRFCKHIGYSGYTEFKLMIAKEIGELNFNRFNEICDLNVTKKDKQEDIPQKVIIGTIKALNDTKRIFNIDEYIKALKAIKNAKRIDIYGVGNSYSVANDAMNKFIRIGLRCNVFSDPHMQIMSAVTLDEKDVAIGISHSGKTKDTIDSLRQAKKSGATIICITNYDASLITEASDIKLLTASYETDFNSETMVARIMQLVIIDMLYLGIILIDYEKHTRQLTDANKALNNKAY